MFPDAIVLPLVLTLTSFAAALGALVVLHLIHRPAPVTGFALSDETVFLFEDTQLIEASPPARALLAGLAQGGEGGDWPRLSGWIGARIAGFSDAMAHLVDRGRIELASDDGDLRVVAEDLGGIARIALTRPRAEGQGVVIDALSQRAQEDELAALRRTVEAAPTLIWREDAAGAVIWANRAYLDRCATEDALATWPLPRLFPPIPADTDAGTLRRKAQVPGPEWYDCTRLPEGAGTLNFAIAADAVVKAETSLREFVQTLSKTFAHLPIGLAIFDRQRQLVLFNPALTDLTRLPVEFLMARPQLFAVLDRLREARVIPEPKDYRSWRRQMADLESAAEAGLYEETWGLANGQTFRVTGRPQPDGAVAFLIEDITGETTLTRRFRSELELGQEVVDQMDEAIAVFAASGDLVLSNKAYGRLWGVDPGATLGRVTIMDAARHWTDATGRGDLWSPVHDFMAAVSTRAPWQGEIDRPDGQRLVCRFAPLAGGATLAGFRLMPARTGLQRRPRVPVPRAQAETAQA